MKAALLLAALLAAMLLTACGDDPVEADPTPAATATASPSPEVTPTATATATPDATPTPDPDTIASSITGIFEAPRDVTPDETRTLEPEPDTTFPSFAGDRTVLYDIAAEEVIDLGPGYHGYFSADGRYMAWSAGPGFTDLRVIDLSNVDEPMDLGPGSWPMTWLSDREVVVRLPNSNAREVVEIETGERRPMDAATADALLRAERQGDLVLLESPPNPTGVRSFALVRADALDEPLLEFEGTRARFAGERELLVLAPWTGESANLFVVDLPTGAATFIATVALEIPIVPISATRDHVLWTDNFCGGEPRRTMLYERATGRIVEIDRAVWGNLTGDGRIEMGEFGGTWIVDIEALEYDVVLPDFGDTQWSPDYAYASKGIVLGHGGQCPP